MQKVLKELACYIIARLYIDSDYCKDRLTSVVRVKSTLLSFRRRLEGIEAKPM